ncbi:hypothetical protein Zm00014a_033145 [Zea mays]|uniref:Uncharacterized protein n=1 Tax=Zea mays TaxID=4577 RepID=A0A3L6E8G4_MAIZE|nr:hypothetical protein Zm00014a_033145 [Zea mays]
MGLVGGRRSQRAQHLYCLPQRGLKEKRGKVRPIDRGAAAPPASEEWRIRSEARGLNPAAGRDAGPRRASSSVPSNGSCPCPEHR